MRESLSTHTTTDPFFTAEKIYLRYDLFTEAYKGDLPVTALAVTESAADASAGAYVCDGWEGKMYSFVAGVNAFATLDDVYAYAQTNGIECPQILYMLDDGGDLTVSYSSEIYASNWNTAPFNEDNTVNAATSGGTNWTENSEYFDAQTTVENIIIGRNTSGGTVGVYGFTFTGIIRDESRGVSDDKTDIRIENCVKDGKVISGNKYIIQPQNAQNKTNSASADTMYVKNLYIRSTAAGSRLIGEYCAANTTFDGLWCDAAASGLDSGTAWIKTVADNSVFTIKNSNLRNFIKSGTGTKSVGLFQFEGYNKADIGGRKSKIVFDNNILQRVVMNTDSLGNFYLFSWYANSYSDFVITNNYIDCGSNSITTSDYNKERSYLFYNRGITEENYLSSDYGDIVITGNFLNGICDGIFVVSEEPYYAGFEFEVHDNFLLTARSDNISDTALIGEKLTINSNHSYKEGTSQQYWLDAAMTVSSVDISGAAGVNAVYIYNADTGVLTLRGTGTLWSGIPSSDENVCYREEVKEIIIEEGFTAVGGNAFGNGKYPNVTKVTLPDGITSIGDSAFYGCTKLSDINLPEGIKTIGEWAFYADNQLKNITFPSTLTAISDYAFYGVYIDSFSFNGVRDDWDNVTAAETGNERLSLTVCTDDSAEFITNSDIILIYNADRETMYIAGTGYAPECTSESALISDELSESIRHIVIDNTVAGFGAYSFTNLINLESVSGGGNMRYLGNWAFKGLTKLTTAEFLEADLFGVLCYGAFSDCSSLNNVTLSDSLKMLGGAAFKNCTSLTSIVIPENISSVAHRMFEGCTALETVEIKTAAELENNAFYGCISLKSVTLPEGLTSIGAWCFAGAQIDTLTLPETLTTVGDYAFYWTTLGTVNYTGDISAVTLGTENSRLTDKI